MARPLVAVLVLLPLASAQLDAFALPSPDRYAPKPTVPPEFRQFFELDGHARELIDSLIGPRPGGFFPEKTYEIGAVRDAPAAGARPAPPVHQISNLERTLEQFFTAPEDSGKKLPPGFNSGFSLQNNNKAVTQFARDGESKTVKKDTPGRSSIDGIPKVFPKLPKAPVAAPPAEQLAAKQPVVAADVPAFPEIRSAPPVPEGGMLPAGDVRRAPESVGEVMASEDPEAVPEGEYGGLAEETSTSSGGLIGTILNLIGLGAKKAKEGAGDPVKAPADPKELGRAVSNLLGGENSPLPAKNVLSNVLYKALTSGSVQRNDSSAEEGDLLNNGTLQLTPAQSAAIGENLEMIQNLIIQPSSPLCTSKPEPVEFDFYALMGQWYQVLYSPPLSSGPCSMVAYKKLSEVNNGGAGSIFETFEYATDGTPYGKPKISSGYAIVKSPGELIYRTASNKEDVNIHVLHTGPLNSKNEYEYVVMSTNCNYPLYVFARDPVLYKQRYEASVMEHMEKKGLINGFSRLLNIVSPVDNAMCTFPPSLFNIQG